MSSLFRGALNLIQGEPGAHGGPTHPLVGQDIEIGSLRLRIRSLIAEGGFAVVLHAQDSQGRQYAVKRQLAPDRDAFNAVINEINILKELNGHKNILRFFEAAQTKLPSGGTEFLILTELCPGGSAVELLKGPELPCEQVLRIFHGACSAVRHMHERERPITHRDIKVENLLFDQKGMVKLCDFGSTTREKHRPDHTWTSARRNCLIEEMQRHTTPMYRAPEILDEYIDLPVGPQQDIWALGCVLFYLCYRVHPFEDSGKLRIINAKYQIPQDQPGYTMFVPLIESCLKINPDERPMIGDLVDRVEALAVAMDIDTNAPAVKRIETQSNLPSSTNSAAMRPPPPASRETIDVSQQASAMFGALKGQGMSIFKNIKDRSTAVVQTVQSTYGGKGPDVTLITSRLIIAPVPEGVPEALAVPAEDVLRAYASEQGRPFLVVNVSQRKLRCEFPTKPLECLQSAPLNGPPTGLNDLFKVCRSISLFLRQNPNGFIVYYGLLQHCVIFCVSALLYNKLMPRPMNAFELINHRRPQSAILLPPSFHRLLDTFCTVINAPQGEILNIVHRCAVRLVAVRMSALPLFNRARTGCRPFVEVYSGSKRLWTTFTSYEQTREYQNPADSEIEIPLDKTPVDDDVTVMIYHARWSKMHTRMQPVFMSSFGFHANFVDRNTNMLTFNPGDLDMDSQEASNIPHGFKVMLALNVEERNRGFANLIGESPAFLSYENEPVDPQHIVSDTIEYESLQSSFITGATKPNRPPAPQMNSKPANVLPEPQNTAMGDFFSTLEWGAGGNSTVTSAAAQRTSPIQDVFAQSDPVQSHFDAKKVDTSEAYERMYGIRVGKFEEDDDADMYRFDCDKPSKNETPILGAPSPVQSSTNIVSDFDLLGLDDGPKTTPSNPPPTQNATMNDPFGDLLGFGSNSEPKSQQKPVDDIFGAWSSASNSANLTTPAMHRNVSAPAMSQTKPATLDPFAEFLSAQHSASNPNSQPGSGANSGTSTPKPSRPNYSRSAFENINVTGVKPKLKLDAFEDLLSSQGFTSTSFSSGPKTMADMRRADEIKDLDPTQIKIRDWIKGKEKNIRALLGSLNDVLWEGADRWQQPTMAELLTAAQVKKWYRKACLVVHPDKLPVGSEEEKLAKAVFTELNEAWTAFEQAGSPSL